MSPTALSGVALPTHLDLPDTDGIPVNSGYEPLQCKLLSDSLLPILHEKYPDGQFFIGEDWAFIGRSPSHHSTAANHPIGISSSACPVS